MIDLRLPTHTAEILYDLVNSSSCEWNGVLVHDKLKFNPSEVNEMLWEVHRQLKERGIQ